MQVDLMPIKSAAQRPPLHLVLDFLFKTPKCHASGKEAWMGKVLNEYKFNQVTQWEY